MHGTAHLHISGFSESRALIMEAGGAMIDLGCDAASCVHCNMLEDVFCRSDARWRTQRNTSFLAFCREDEQLQSVYEVPCKPRPALAWPAVNLSYAWKSFVDSPLDDVIENYLLERARRQPTVAVFSAGAHHFAQHHEHTNHHQTHLKDNWTPPQAWLDTWVNGTLRMMTRLARLRASGVCCVWKTNNVGSRLLEGFWHHPSVEGGLHDYLNKFSISIAREHGVPVVDLTTLTVGMTRDVEAKEGALPGLTDTDYYHQYRHSVLWGRVRDAVFAECLRPAIAR